MHKCDVVARRPADLGVPVACRHASPEPLPRPRRRDLRASGLGLGGLEVRAARGLPFARHAGEVQQGGRPEGGPEEREEHPRAEPGHVRERRLLRSARGGHRAQGEGLAGLGGRAQGEPARGPLRPQPREDRPLTGQQLFDYYLGWLTDSSITNHFQFIPDAQVAYARRWGMRVEIEDLRRVVQVGAAGG